MWQLVNPHSWHPCRYIQLQWQCSACVCLCVIITKQKADAISPSQLFVWLWAMCVIGWVSDYLCRLCVCVHALGCYLQSDGSFNRNEQGISHLSVIPAALVEWPLAWSFPVLMPATLRHCWIELWVPYLKKKGACNSSDCFLTSILPQGVWSALNPLLCLTLMKTSNVAHQSVINVSSLDVLSSFWNCCTKVMNSN